MNKQRLPCPAKEIFDIIMILQVQAHQ